MPKFNENDSIKWEETFGDGRDGVFTGDGDLFAPHTFFDGKWLENPVGFYDDNLVILNINEYELEHLKNVNPPKFKYEKDYPAAEISVIKQFKTISVPRGARVGTDCGKNAVFMAQESIQSLGQIEGDGNIFFIAPTIELYGSISTPGKIYCMGRKVIFPKLNIESGQKEFRYSNLLNCMEGEVAIHDDTYLNGTETI